MKSAASGSRVSARWLSSVLLVTTCPPDAGRGRLADRYRKLRRSLAEFRPFGIFGAPYGTRTRVTAVKGRRPGPLDEGRAKRRDI